MERFNVVLEGKARREFARLHVDLRGRFYVAFQALAEDPYRPRSGCDIRKLSGKDEVWAVRVGGFRGVYAIDGDTIRFTTFQSGHRAYR